MKKKLVATAVLATLSHAALANIDIQFDYTYDTSAFFTGANAYRQSVLDAAAAEFEVRLTDSLGAITSSGSNDFTTSFFNPSNPFTSDISLPGQNIGTDVILVYVGAYSYGGATLGLGGPGGYGCSGFGGFCSSTTLDRGQGDTTGSDAVDFAPWGGAISFDSETTWNFSMTPPSGGEYDLYSVAVHELAHVLGFGTSDSFANHVSGLQFSGDASGTVAMDDDAHWASSVTSTVNGLPPQQQAAMTPSISSGTRKYFTDLDFAALSDVGWTVSPVPEADTWAMMLAGLGLLGLSVRRRLPART